MNSSEKHECSWDGPSMAPSSGEPYECHDEGTMFRAGVGVHFCARHHHLFERDFGKQFKQHTGTTISDLLDIVDEVERRVGL